MDLVSIIKNNTDYDPTQYELDAKVIATIEKGEPAYKILWDNFLDPNYRYIIDLKDIHIDVEMQLNKEYERSDQRLGKIKEVMKGIRYGIIIGGIVGIDDIKSLIRFVCAYISVVYIDKLISKHLEKSRSYWENLPEEKILESIVRIKEKAGQIIFQELERIRLSRADD